MSSSPVIKVNPSGIFSVLFLIPSSPWDSLGMPQWLPLPCDFLLWDSHPNAPPEVTGRHWSRYTVACILPSNVWPEMEISGNKCITNWINYFVTVSVFLSCCNFSFPVPPSTKIAPSNYSPISFMNGTVGKTYCIAEVLHTRRTRLHPLKEWVNDLVHTVFLF